MYFGGSEQDKISKLKSEVRKLTRLNSVNLAIRTELEAKNEYLSKVIESLKSEKEANNQVLEEFGINDNAKEFIKNIVSYENYMYNLIDENKELKKKYQKLLFENQEMDRKSLSETQILNRKCASITEAYNELKNRKVKKYENEINDLNQKITKLRNRVKYLEETKVSEVLKNTDDEVYLILHSEIVIVLQNEIKILNESIKNLYKDQLFDLYSDDDISLAFFAVAIPTEYKHEGSVEEGELFKAMMVFLPNLYLQKNRVIRSLVNNIDYLKRFQMGAKHYYTAKLIE